MIILNGLKSKISSKIFSNYNENTVDETIFKVKNLDSYSKICQSKN
ncbi:hypothetical protein SAMN05443292_2942 [Halpernia frigidisoli]|uniref:Uncharacterized protein n=1 Tax=Halpernia frigidisoli TaxID=1125876 RepID=A0A1I3J557_9FLAO|nr:hypothetical protein SAMN05443292_2942 [Halpernia frigidisoli]